MFLNKLFLPFPTVNNSSCQSNSKSRARDTRLWKKHQLPQLFLLTSEKRCRFVMVRWMSTRAESSFKRKSQGAIHGPNGLQLLLLVNMYRKVACQLPRNCFSAIHFLSPPCITHFTFFSSPDTSRTKKKQNKLTTPTPQKNKNLSVSVPEV